MWVVTTTPNNLSISATLVTVSVVVGWVIFFTFVAMAMNKDEKRKYITIDKNGTSSSGQKESYVDWASGSEPTLSVMRISPTERLEISVPSFVYPASDAFSVLSVFRDAGIRVRHQQEETGTDPRATMAVSDSLRFHRHRLPHEKMVSVLRDSLSHVCLFGNLATVDAAVSSGGPSSTRQRRDKEQEEQEEPVFVSALSYSIAEFVKAPPPPGLTILCRDQDDIFALNTVLFSCGVNDVETRVNEFDIRFVSCPTECLHMFRTIEGPCLIAMTLTEHHPLWDSLEDTELVWFGYEEIDVKKLKIVAPFAVTTSLDVPSRLSKSIIGRRRVYSLISFHVVVFGGKLAETNRLSHTVSTSLIRGDLDKVFDVTAMNNYLSIYFPFTPDSLRVMSLINDELYRKRYANPSQTLLGVGRPQFNVLEQFTNGRESGQVLQAPPSPPLTIKIDDNIRCYENVSRRGNLKRIWVKTYDGFKSDSSQLLRYTGHGAYTLRGIPVKIWDRVILKNQMRRSENGTYFFVYAFPEGQGIILQDKLALFVNLEKDVLKSSTKITTSLMTRPKLASTEIGDRVYVLFSRLSKNKQKESNSFKGYVGAVIRKDDKSVDITLDKSESEFEDGKTHPLYYCVTDASIAVKEQCDEAGEVWDRPCMSDTECPYFQANRNYPNYRGGCVAGHCEMPLGVEKAGFRRPVSGSQKNAVCHNCVHYFRGSGGCCEEQEQKLNRKQEGSGFTSPPSTLSSSSHPTDAVFPSQYRNLITPDYAFELDEFERKHNARPGWKP